MLVRGEPNWGCLVGGNELGHTRLPVDTEPCYCGHSGCMERICSTDFLNRQGDVSSDAGTLLERVAQYDGSQPALDRMIDLLGTGLANAVNFIRPHRVVLVSRYTRYGPFTEGLVRAVRSRIMTTLADRVAFHYVDGAATRAGEAAGWLALAAIYYPNWTKAILTRPTAVESEPY
jgi:predicted NBD/HSP70 family sugar kinase